MKKLSALLMAFLSLCGFGNAHELAIYTENSNSAHTQIVLPSGELSGAAVDLVRAIQRRIGNKQEIQIVPWARGYTLASRGDPNVLLFSMARTPEREALFKWVGPVRQTEYSFYTKADSPLVIRSLDDARNVKAIGTFRMDVREQFLKREGFTNLEGVSENSQNVKKLMAGRIDMFVASKTTVPDLLAKAGYQATDIKHLYAFLKADLYLAFSKETPDAVVQEWDNALADIKKDGTYAKIHAKYMG